MKDDYCLPSAMTAWELKLREAFYQKPSDTSYNSLLIWFTFINKLQLRELLGGMSFWGRWWFALKTYKSFEVSIMGYIFSSAMQLQSSCSCFVVISLTHVVCTKCYQANSWVKRRGPDPPNGIFRENTFSSFLISCSCLSGCKWKVKYPPWKVSTESDLHCIIQIAVKCIIHSNYMVQY